MATVEKECLVLIKTNFQNQFSVGHWMTDQEWVKTLVLDWLPGGKEYQRFAEDGEYVEYVKVMVRDWVPPAGYDNVEE